MPMAVIDGIAAAVGGDQERIVPACIEQRRQRVGFVMIVEVDLRIVAKAAGAPEFGNLENVVEPWGVIAKEFRRHVTARVLLDVFSIFFAQPAHAGNILVENRREFRTAEADGVGILPRRSGDREYFVDGAVRMLVAGNFAPRQPLKLHRAEQFVFVEQGGSRIMGAGMHAQNKRHLCGGLEWYVPVMYRIASAPAIDGSRLRAPKQQARVAVGVKPVAGLDGVGVGAAHGGSEENTS